MVQQTIKNGVPPSEKWPVPIHVRGNSTVLEGLLGKKAFDLYIKFNDDERNVAIEYVENCGPEVCEMLGCPVYERWNKEKITLSTDRLYELYENYGIKYTDIIARDETVESMSDSESLGFELSDTTSDRSDEQ